MPGAIEHFRERSARRTSSRPGPRSPRSRVRRRRRRRRGAACRHVATVLTSTRPPLLTDPEHVRRSAARRPTLIPKPSRAVSTIAAYIFGSSNASCCCLHVGADSSGKRDPLGGHADEQCDRRAHPDSRRDARERRRERHTHDPAGSSDAGRPRDVVEQPIAPTYAVQRVDQDRPDCGVRDDESRSSESESEEEKGHGDEHDRRNRAQELDHDEGRIAERAGAPDENPERDPADDRDRESLGEAFQRRADLARRASRTRARSRAHGMSADGRAMLSSRPSRRVTSSTTSARNPTNEPAREVYSTDGVARPLHVR